MAVFEQAEPQFRRRRWHHRRDLRFLIVVATLLVLYFAYGFIIGPSVISDRLHTRLDQEPARVNILVTSRFPPEAFHMGVYQDIGSMRGTRGRTSTLFRVKPADIRRLSRRYWIETIDLAPVPKG